MSCYLSMLIVIVACLDLLHDPQLLPLSHFGSSKCLLILVTLLVWKTVVVAVVVVVVVKARLAMLRHPMSVLYGLP